MVTKELIDYIKKQIAKGQNKDDIRKILLQYKWSETDVDQAFLVVQENSAPKTEPTKVQTPVIENKTVAQPQNTQPSVQAQPIQKPVAPSVNSQPAQKPQSSPAPTSPPRSLPTQSQPSSPAIQKPVNTAVQQPAPSINNRPQAPVNGSGQGQNVAMQPKPAQPQSVLSQTAKPYQPTQPVSPFVRPGGQNTGPLQPARPQFKVNDQTGQNDDQIRSIVLFAVIAIVVLIIGVSIYFAISGNKRPAEKIAPTSTPEQIVSTTSVSNTPNEPVKRASLLDVPPVSYENLSDEFNKVLTCLKNKNASEAEKTDCQKSDKMVNIGFFLELYYSKNGKYPEVITEIFNLGTYKILDRYGASIYEYSYNGSENGNYVLCAQYSTGFRCFIPDESYKTKAKQFMNKLK